MTDWAGEVAHIVAGGPSVRDQNLELLRGRKVIVINSSYLAVPWADILFFGDFRWWREHQGRLTGFAGRMITASASVRHPRVENRKKQSPPGLSNERNTVAMRRTSLSGAINEAVHLGVRGIVLLGADGRRDADGRTHHHDPHQWPVRPGCWDIHRQELETLVEPLNQLGIKVLNASPGSAWPMWPVMSLSEAINEMDGNELLSDQSIQLSLQGSDGRCRIAGAG